MTRSKAGLLGGVLLMLILLARPAMAQAVHVIERASLSSSGVEGDGGSYDTSLSADGRYVAFYSYASNLVTGDTNNGGSSGADIFVRDRVTGITTRVDVDSFGNETPLFSDSFDPSISADGRYVAFDSDAGNLVDGDTNGTADVFVHDLQTGVTERVSVSSTGTQGNGESYRPAISADGRYVAFLSLSSDLVPGDTNNAADVFVHDRVIGATVRVTVDSAGVQANDFSWDCAISGNGRVAFQSSASNLVAGDTNGSDDIFVRDLQSGTTQRVSVDGAGTQATGGSYDPAISADGRYVAFSSDSANLAPGDTNARRDAFVRDCTAGTTERASVSSAEIQGNLSSGCRSISGDGRYVAFLSYATNLVPGDTNGREDVFVRDRTAGTTCRVNTSAAGVQANGLTSLSASLSAGGDYVAFDSMATNLVPGDTNGYEDVFVAMNRPEPVDYRSLRGTDRYDTAIKMSQALFPGPLPPDSGLVLAPGETYQEALCGAPLAAAYGGPVLFNPGVGLNNAVRNEIVRLAPKYVICVGLSDSIKDAVQAALGATGTASVIRGGNNCVYDLSEQVAKALGAKLGDMSASTAIITRGDKFPDAIGILPLACANKWPILLTGNSTGVLWACQHAGILLLAPLYGPLPVGPGPGARGLPRASAR